jgi:hypothetical protein
VACFNVFTNLKHTEAYLYLEDRRRCVKPGGIITASFLEFAEPAHWQVFQNNLDAERGGKAPHLDTFIERIALSTWALRLALEALAFVGGQEAP